MRIDKQLDNIGVCDRSDQGTGDRSGDQISRAAAGAESRASALNTIVKSATAYA
jgi:hypothetical protein